jgi:hypothetical protein
VEFSRKSASDKIVTNLELLHPSAPHHTLIRLD